MSTEPKETVDAAALVAVQREKQQRWLDSIKTFDSWTPDTVALIKNTVAKGATDDELRLFAAVCARTKLDPFTKQIYLVKRYDSKAVNADGTKGADVAVIQVGIDGLRVIAERSGNHGGISTVEWCAADGKWVDLWVLPTQPFACRIIGHRVGWVNPVVVVVRWSAYPTQGFMWAQRGPEQLAKCAEAQLLRLIAPNDLSGLYAPEEIGEDDAPLRINEYKPKDAGAATAKAAVDAALAGPATSTAVVVEDAKPEPEKPAAPAGEPDYEQEAKRILAAVTKARYDTKGGPARWESAKHELVTWATRKGLAPAEIDAKAVYGFALAYQQFKAETAGEGATEAAPVGTDPAPATEVTGEGSVDGPAGAHQPEPVTTPAVPLVTAAHLIDRLTRAGKAFGVDALGRNKRPFVQPHNGAVWLVDKEILDACGWNESMNLSDAANEQFFSIIAITLTGILTKHERDNKPAPRGPVGPPVL